MQLSRNFSMIGITFVTCMFFILDKLLSDWALSTTIHWPDLPWPDTDWLEVMQQNVPYFSYFLGFITCYLFLWASRSFSRARTQTILGKKTHKEPSPRNAFSSTGRTSPTTGSSAVPSAPRSARASEEMPVQLSSSVHAALQQGDAAKAFDSLMQLESSGLASGTVIYNMIMRAYSKLSDISGAENVFDRMCKRGLEPNEYSYNTLMNLYAKADDVEGVEYWMHRMETDGVLPPSSVSFAIVIHARARRGEELEAEAWLQRMSQAGHEPQCVNYNSMIHACSVNRKVERAEEWFEKMRASGIEPTVMTYTALVDTCSKCLAVQSAEKWMQAMLDVNIKPNVVSFSAMLDACARVGDLARAERWHDKMLDQEVKPNAYIYSAIINACAKACDLPAACTWLTRAQSSGADLDSVVYGCVINACGKVGDSKRAMTVFRQMRNNGIRSHIVVYGALARPFAYQGEWEEVERIAEEMEAEGIKMNDYFLYTMLLAYSRAKPRRPDKAEMVFCDAMAKGLTPNDRIIKALSTSVGRARALQLVDGFP